ncbi:MAG: hypothetical protein AABY27_01270 [Pseudomonadota bacterium]
MSKLKLYNHSEESRQDLLYDLGKTADLLQDGELVDEFSDWVALQEQNKGTSNEDSLFQKMQFYEKFSNKLDKYYTESKKTDANSRAERDLIKHQMLSAIESWAVQSLIKNENPNHIAAFDTMPKDTNFSELEKKEYQFSEYIKLAQVTQYSNNNERYCPTKELTILHKLVQDNFIQLAKHYKSPESNRLEQEILSSRNNEGISIDTNNSAKSAALLGNSTWREWFGDILHNVKSVIVKIGDFMNKAIKQKNMNVDAVADAFDSPPFYSPPPVPGFNQANIRPPIEGANKVIGPATNKVVNDRISNKQQSIGG